MMEQALAAFNSGAFWLILLLIAGPIVAAYYSTPHQSHDPDVF